MSACLASFLWIKLKACHRRGVSSEQAGQVAGGGAIQSNVVCRGDRDQSTVCRCHTAVRCKWSAAADQRH